ncbi:MAG TPA: phosphatase PAP2 family protein [Coxiellaceae bacterium]|nr:phosphatase PAP2 family protein [Coxiellaceae bacterium]
MSDLIDFELDAMKIGITFVALILLSLLFWQKPELDQIVAASFYSVKNRHFWLAEHHYLELWRHVVVALLFLMSMGLAITLILKIIKPSLVKKIKAKTALYVLLCFLVGPGLIVNLILKDHWGRPRPSQVEIYGGMAIFQPVWKVSQQCNRNCSFVCGDCAMVFTLFAWVPLVRRQKLALVLVSLAGLTISALRVSAGGHFLSDALIAGLISYLVVNLIYNLMYSSQKFSEERTEHFFTLLHAKFMRLL